MNQRKERPERGEGGFDRRSSPYRASSMRPTQCTVYLKHVDTSAALKSDGSLAVQAQDYVCFIFDTFKQAHEFCKSKVRQYPFMCCEVYDSEGKAMPPMLVVKHGSVAEKDETSGSWIRTRKALGLLLVTSALVLLLLAWRVDESWVFLTVIGPVIGYFMLLTGCRLLDWNLAIKEATQECERRLQAHLDREKQVTRDQAGNT